MIIKTLSQCEGKADLREAKAKVDEFKKSQEKSRKKDKVKKTPRDFLPTVTAKKSPGTTRRGAARRDATRVTTRRRDARDTEMITCHVEA